VEGASGTQHLSPVLGGAGYRVLPWSDPMIRVVELWNPLLIWAGPGPPNLFYIHIRLIDEALFQLYTAHSDVGGTVSNRLNTPPPPPAATYFLYIPYVHFGKRGKGRRRRVEEQ
jgi:hypothetical protein